MQPPLSISSNIPLTITANSPIYPTAHKTQEEWVSQIKQHTHVQVTKKQPLRYYFNSGCLPTHVFKLCIIKHVSQQWVWIHWLLSNTVKHVPRIIAGGFRNMSNGGQCFCQQILSQQRIHKTLFFTSWHTLTTIMYVETIPRIGHKRKSHEWFISNLAMKWWIWGLSCKC